MSNATPAKGETAPDFNMPRDGNTQVSLSDYSDNALVLFFYPKDDTSGCTVETIDFSKAQDAFEAAGAKLLGVSRDSIESHEKFIAKHALTVPLASDESGKTSQDYGVWVEKNMYGKKYMGIERSTFLIRNGQIEQVWRKVKVPGHVDAVLAAVTAD